MIKAIAALSVLALASPAVATSSSADAGGPGVVFARVDLDPSAVAVYRANNTIYSANNARNDISIVNGANCDAATSAGCSQPPPRQDVGIQPDALAINQRTGTLYVANYTNAAHGTVSIVNARTCSATNTSHCTVFPHLPPAVRLPFDPSDIAINERTNTIYVDGAGNQLAVIDGRNCNGTRSTGCRRAVHVTRVAAGAGGVAVNSRTNTLYVVSYFTGLVSVISGRMCEAGNVSGCAHRRATVRVGRHPFRLTSMPPRTPYMSRTSARTRSR